MRTLDVRIAPSPALFGGILGLHALGVVAFAALGVPAWLWWLPLAAGFIGARQRALLRARSSAVRLRYLAGRWYWYQRDGWRSPPQRLCVGSRGSRYCLQLGFKPLHHTLWPRRRWLLLTPKMVGEDNYRRLYVHLRWSAGGELPAVR